jgi:hypothetical protein
MCNRSLHPTRFATFFSLRDATKAARSARTPCRVWRIIGDRLAEIYFDGDRVTHVAYGETLGLTAVRGFLDYDEDWFIDHGVTWHRQTLLVEWDRLLDAAATPVETYRPGPEDETFRLESPRRQRGGPSRTPRLRMRDHDSPADQGCRLRVDGSRLVQEE